MNWGFLVFFTGLVSCLVGIALLIGYGWVLSLLGWYWPANEELKGTKNPKLQAIGFSLILIGFFLGLFGLAFNS